MPDHIKRRYAIAWAATVLMLLIDLIWAHRIALRVSTASTVQSVQMVAGMFLIAGACLAISRRPLKNPARKLFYANVAYLLLWATLLVAFTHVCVVFQYLCVTTNFPLVSDAFVSFDAALGFHWLDAYRWVQTHHGAHAVLELAYLSGGMQLVLIPAVLALTSHWLGFAEFAVQFMVSTTLVILIALFFPAESAFVHFGIHDPGTVSTVSDFARLRSGTAGELGFASAQGLVSFPSLHTILALCYAYALRHVRLLFPVAIALNLIMILSTPTQGGHYLCDTLSGLLMGFAVIYLVRKLFAESVHTERSGVEREHMTLVPKK